MFSSIPRISYGLVLSVSQRGVKRRGQMIGGSVTLQEMQFRRSKANSWLAIGTPEDLLILPHSVAQPPNSMLSNDFLPQFGRIKYDIKRCGVKCLEPSFRCRGEFEQVEGQPLSVNRNRYNSGDLAARCLVQCRR